MSQLIDDACAAGARQEQACALLGLSVRELNQRMEMEQQGAEG